MAENIIYYCYGGAHSSVVTAAIHLGLLAPDIPPTSEELMLVPYYDHQQDQDHGKIRLMGEDQQGNKVYIVGQRTLSKGFTNLVHSFIELQGKEYRQPVLVDTLSGVNLPMRIGGFISRKLKLVSIGRPLVIWGTKRAYANFVKLAKKNQPEGEMH